MKLLEIETKTKEINWNKAQWLQYIENKNIIVLLDTEGTQTSSSFSGTALPCVNYKNGRYYTNWSKIAFKPLETDILFVISNKY